jgi:simple sugar transport system ATP-binding protein
MSGGLGVPILSLRGISKHFPGVIANDHVDLDVLSGEVHAVVGENGAGKSTLAKILYGFYRADAGEICVDGQPRQIRSPRDARRLGIGMVFQEFAQVPALTVTENIALFLPDLPSIPSAARLAHRIETTSRRYGLDLDASAPIWRLSVGERQRVEILKLLLAEARVLVLDEPTRSLAPHEIDALFATFDGLRRDGYAVLFIAHKLREVLACADRITVLRGGRVVGSLRRAEATEGQLVSLMFGGAVTDAIPRRARSGTPGPALLELIDADTAAEGRATALEAIALTVARGEIVGVAGVAGNGQRELGDLILGLERCTRGGKRLGGQDAARWSVAKVRASGVAFIPEDALGMAAVPTLTAVENMALGDTRRYGRAGGLLMDWRAARGDLERALAELRVALPSFDRLVGTLSGGNVQRLVLAREMARQPRLIVAFYPTRGLDARSSASARDLLAAARDAGTGVLLISEDLDELFSLSDRLVVLCKGRIVADTPPSGTSREEVGYLMTGTAGPS